MQICITNRHLAEGNFLERLKLLAGRKDIGKIILREKDLDEKEYEKLARDCYAVCREKGMPFAVNKYIDTAMQLGIQEVQVSMDLFLREREKLQGLSVIGVSVHSVEEAKEAEIGGAGYLIAGHVFPTDCKKGVPARGLSWLTEVCSAVQIPVYGIGGITEENMPLILRAGAAGGCLMSGFMKLKLTN